ncbi:radical SAM protein [Streptomyces microflavus]|uniref:radical SAM protein n=1 Tax=Streptomyces microflavus TaxID=1919 RepID=UPI0037F8A946
MTTATAGRALIPIAEAGEAVTLIVKLVGDACNINCYYCYEKRKGDEDGVDRVSVGEVRSALDALGGRPAVVHLHGGEPLLYGRGGMRDLLAELSRRENVVGIQVQTNGLLLDDGWLDLFENSVPPVEIGVSLDGDEQHNSYRVNFADRGTSAQVAQALDLLGRREIPFGMIMVVHDRNVAEPDRIFDLVAHTRGLVNVNLVPCFDQGQAPRSVPSGNRGLLELVDAADSAVGNGWAVSPNAYLEFLRAFTERWIDERAYRRFNVEPVMSALRRRGGKDARMCHYSERKCGHIYTLYPGGRFGSCDELSPVDSLLAHDLRRASPSSLEDVWATPLGRRQLKVISAPLAECASCSAQSLCGGGCMATRTRLAAAGRSEDYCDYRRGFVFWLDSVMRELEAQDAGQ